MAFSYDITTDRGKVRRLINDVVDAGHIFEDDEVDAFLEMEGASVKRGAALGIETIARNEAYVQKVITLMELKTDGAKTAEVLLKSAKALREQAVDEEATEADAMFDVAEQVFDVFSLRERLAREALRDA